MSYIFKGTLCGRLCDDCEEDLLNVQVKLYRLRKDQQKTVLATANPKDTFSILSEKEIKAKQKSLIAEEETDGSGRFEFDLGDNQDYEGQAFEIDVVVEKAPGQEKRPERVDPVQFTITTLQPQWRKGEQGAIAVWEYCISQRFWCKIREKLGAWIICGRVVSCETQANKDEEERTIPISGLEVSAFDADWLQDDALGSATTDSNGKFKIYYSRGDFEKTPLSPVIDLELVGGPDLYFKIASEGSFVLEESQSKGREDGRENRGPCFCIELCVPLEEDPPTDDPLFTHVGNFHILSDIDSASGLTNKAIFGGGGPNYGFHNAPKLYGYCPKRFPADTGPEMKYRFRYEDLDNDPGTEVDIKGDLLLPVKVGSRLILWDLDGSGPSYTFQSIYVADSGATPDPTPTPSVPPGTPWGPVPAHVIEPDSDGWIIVDQNALDGGFQTLLRFNTRKVVPSAGAPGNGAGNAITDPKNGTHLKLIYEAAPVGSGTSVVHRDELPNILVNNWSEVRQLNLEQFTGAGNDSCSPLTSDLDIKYTIDHELIADWKLSVQSAAFSPSSNLPAPASNPIRSGTTPRGDADTAHLDISSWPSCSYKVWLSSRRALTDGEIDDDGDRTLVTFCK